MRLQYEDMHTEKELDEVELHMMGNTLIGLVNYYKQFLPVTTNETLQDLNMLHNIGTAIIRKDYHLLLNDPKAVIGNQDDISLQEYQESVFEAMCDQHFSGKPF